jgi:signal transduction histidine kinase
MLSRNTFPLNARVLVPLSKSSPPVSAEDPSAVFCLANPSSGRDRGLTATPATANRNARQQSLEVERIVQESMKLLGTAAHDLRQPVAAILAYGELLSEDADRTMSPEQAELLQEIVSMSEFALRLLEDTLDLANAESGTVQLHAVPASLVPVVAQSVALNTPLADRKRIRLRFIQQSEPVLVLVDSLKMSKVFNNLIENAIKYCEPGSEIRVRISRSGDRVLASVQDNGPGIASDDVKNLFTPFQRTQARARSEEPGTGLGLSIAKNIVELHGGRIWAETQIGKGTTFYVSLPICTLPVQASLSGHRSVRVANAGRY